jgi:hypothetical protein
VELVFRSQYNWQGPDQRFKVKFGGFCCPAEGS